MYTVRKKPAAVSEGQLPVTHILTPKAVCSNWDTRISEMPNQLWVRLQHGLRPVMIYIWWDGTSVFQFGLFIRNLLAGISLNRCPGMWQDNWKVFWWSLVIFLPFTSFFSCKISSYSYLMKIECLPHPDHCIFSSNLSVFETFKAAITVQIKSPVPFCGRHQ